MNKIKTGSHISREKTTFKKKENNLNVNNDYYGKIPTGILIFIFNLLFFIVVLLLGLYIPNDKINSLDAFAIASYSSFCICLLELIFRKDFFLNSRFYFFSIWRKSFGLKIYKIFNKNNLDYKNNINDKNDYKIFLNKKNDKSKLWFFLSIIVFILLVIISTILVFVF